MIVVDIGNSGLRAARIGPSQTLDSETRVFRLAWSASVSAHRKRIPEQVVAPDLQWCQADDPRSFQWLIDQLIPLPNERWWIASVHRPALEQLHACILRCDPKGSIQTVTYRDLPMKIDVEAPEKTGIDRLLSAYAGRIECSRRGNTAGATIIVQAGTAVTVDLVSNEDIYQGGAIMPGLGLSLQFLAAGTDQLPWLGNHHVASQPSLPGKNTQQAISAGVYAALVGGTAQLVSRYRDALLSQGGSEPTTVVTGGDGPLIFPQVPGPKHLIEHLVLRGIHAIAETGTLA